MDTSKTPDKGVGGGPPAIGGGRRAGLLKEACTVPPVFSVTNKRRGT